MQSARFLTSKLAKLNKQDHVEAINTIVGEGAVVEGHFQIADSIRVDGTFRGKITSSGSLIVSTQGEVDADLIQVKDAVVDGCVKGPLDASHSVRLGPSAEVDGDITTQVLIVEKGAVLRGTCAAAPNAVDIKKQKEDKEKQEEGDIEKQEEMDIEKQEEVEQVAD